MRDLSRYRADWEERRIVEGQLLSRMTIAESVAEMRSLDQRCKQRLLEDDEVYLAQRVLYLTEMQARLKRLDHFMRAAGLG